MFVLTIINSVVGFETDVSEFQKVTILDGREQPRCSVSGVAAEAAREEAAGVGNFFPRPGVPRLQYLHGVPAHCNLIRTGPSTLHREDILQTAARESTDPAQPRRPGQSWRDALGPRPTR